MTCLHYLSSLLYSPNSLSALINCPRLKVSFNKRVSFQIVPKFVHSPIVKFVHLELAIDFELKQNNAEVKG